jgi:hypothetical protein
MTLREYIGSEISEDNVHDYAVSSDESIVKQVIEAISSKIKTTTTYDDITFGQLVLIENYMKMDDPCERMLSVLATFYRPTEEKAFDNTNEATEEANKALFDGLIFGVVFELFERVMNDRKDFFYNKFAGVVYSKPTESASQEEEIPTLESHFMRIFGWYDRQRTISKEMNIPFQDVLELKATECMVELAYQGMKYKVESKRNNTK